MNESVRFWLQHMSRPDILMRLNRLKRQIYKPVFQLNAKMAVTEEPVAFNERESLDYTSVNKGKRWGGCFACAWFEFCGRFERDAGKSYVVIIDTGSEACIVDADGSAVLGLTGVLAVPDMFQTVKGKRVVPLERVADGADIRFWVDAGLNNGTDPKKTATFGGAVVCEFDKCSYDKYYDLLYKSQKKFGLKDGADFCVSAIGHGHLDLAWLWPLRETKRKALRTITNQLYNAEKYPEYVFGLSQPQILDWVKESDPKLYAKIKDAVKKGNIELQGGMWVEPDTNLPSGESLIRQCLYGQRFYEKEFGMRADYLWLPDVFGYTAALPQIIKKSGMDSFATIKLSWNTVNKFPYQSFVWKGVDGTEVLTHMSPDNDYNSHPTPYTVKKITQEYKEKAVSKNALMIYGIGDGGGGPGEYHVEMTSRLAKAGNTPAVRFSTVKAFFKRLEDEKSRLPVYKGELYLEKHQGTYTTQAKIKKYNRLLEEALHNAEWLCTAAAVNGFEYPHKKLESIWKGLLLNQFHDILPGSSINRVCKEAEESLESAIIEAGELADSALEYLGADGSYRPTLYNPSDFRVCGHYKCFDKIYKYDIAPYCAAELAEEEQPNHLSASNFAISNDIMKITFDAQGQIERLISFMYDGVEYANGFYNGVRIYDDKKLNPYNAWDIDINYTKLKPHLPRLQAYRVFIEDSSAIRENEYVYGDSKITQRIILESGKDYIRVENRVDWRETNKMLRIDNYPSFWSDEVLCNIQFGNIKRSTKNDTSVEYAQFEVCAHKWVDIHDGEHGIAILCPDKYGYRVKEGLISINCLRSTVYPDKTADKGHHFFEYAIYPHLNKSEKSRLLEIGYEMSRPVIKKSNFAEIPPIISHTGGKIVTESIFMTENGDIAVRMYEPWGEEAETELRVHVPHKKIAETNMLFDEIGEINDEKLHFSPYEIKTLLIKI